jgi:FkbM family methyltransferase
MLRSFAQRAEDIVLWRCFRDQPEGLYVDVGASSPIDDSVTQLFYERGWNGFNIEPIPERAAELRRARPRDITIEAAAGASDGEIDLYRTQGVGGLSSASLSGVVTPENSWPITTRRITLDSVLDRYGVHEIDFLKIDVEGHEREVIAGLDLTRWRPKIIVVEAVDAATRRPSEAVFEPMLIGYERCLFDGLNIFYLAREHAALRPHLREKASAADGFLPYAARRRHPLTDIDHIDHAFAVHLAAAYLRSIGLETDAQLERMFVLDLPPAVLDGAVRAATVEQAYRQVLGRAPSPEEADAAVAAGGDGRMLIRRLIASGEFVNLRTRMAKR